MCIVTNMGGLFRRGTRHVQPTNVRLSKKGQCWQSIDQGEAQVSVMLSRRDGFEIFYTTDTMLSNSVT